MRKLLLIGLLALVSIAPANAQPAWLPAHSVVPADSISPDGRYGVMMTDSYEDDTPNQLVEMKTGDVVADLAGDPGWEGNPSMRWGNMEAKWSADSSTLCWIHPDKWFPSSYVVLKLQQGKVAWQVELMKAADREILARTEAAAPLNFAITKMNNDGDGSAYPEGFGIDVSEKGDKFSLPLVCTVALTSNTKASENEPEENGVRAWLTLTVGADGALTYSGFKVKSGSVSQGAKDRLKAQGVGVSLIDTDLGKAMLFPGLGAKDGAFALGWTVQAARKGEPPVDWGKWDASDPDKVLRRYDWECYGDESKMALPYAAIDFVLNTRTGKTIALPTHAPNWPAKKDDWQMLARWYFGAEGRRFGLIASGQEDDVANLWLVVLDESPPPANDLTAAARKAVNALLRERRPEVAAGDFWVSYPLKSGDAALDKSGQVEIPFVATVPSSDQKEFQLSGSVAIRLADGTVVGAASEQKRLDPFVANEALKKADEMLNANFQARLKSLSPEDAQVFKKEERDWIAQRDADATQAVNILSEDSPQQACEEAREKSLLESTRKRIEELAQPAR